MRRTVLISNDRNHQVIPIPQDLAFQGVSEIEIIQ